jgi:putative oxidoreductase
MRGARFTRGFHTNTLARFKKFQPVLHVNIPSRSPFSADLSKPLAHWSGWPLRLIVGYGFMAHGYAKIVRGPDVFAGILNALHMPAPSVLAWATIAVELLGGLAILLGAYVAWVSVPMAAILIVAALTVHLPNGFSSIKLLGVTASGAQFGQPGYEADLLYLACLAALVLGGAGPLAIDGLRRRSAFGSSRAR